MKGMSSPSVLMITACSRSGVGSSVISTYCGTLQLDRSNIMVRKKKLDGYECENPELGGTKPSYLLKDKRLINKTAQRHTRHKIQ